jgi:hypothetical protein
MQWIPHAAPVSSCLSANGVARSIAKAIAIGACVPDPTLRERAREVASRPGAVGKVHAGGAWRDPAIHRHLAEALGTRLASALRPDFEWYYCRGAFFHNDAHYEARLFGVWCIEGPPMQLVFPRAALQVAIAPASIVVFDPFEVHGVLAPGCSTYAANDYQSAEASVLVGFELDINGTIADAFDIEGDVSGHVISSRTRIDANSGAIESVG